MSARPKDISFAFLALLLNNYFLLQYVTETKEYSFVINSHFLLHLYHIMEFCLIQR